MNDETRAMSPVERLQKSLDCRDPMCACRGGPCAECPEGEAVAAASPDSAPAQEARHLTLTKRPDGELVMVSWQDDEHRILETVWLKSPPAQEAAVTQQPATSAVLVAWMWQHDETGRTGFVAADFDRAHWEQHNPRLAIVAPLYDAPITPEPAQSQAAEVEALPCGHPASLMLKSAETGAGLYCQCCDAQSRARDAEKREGELQEELRAALATKQVAPESAQPATSAVPRDTYLCRAWGESNLPIVQVVYSRAGIEQFIIDQWLGERDGQDFDGAPTLPRVMAEFDENEGWFHAEFEIGGIAIDRVHVLTEEAVKS